MGILHFVTLWDAVVLMTYESDLCGADLSFSVLGSSSEFDLFFPTFFVHLNTALFLRQSSSLVDMGSIPADFDSFPCMTLFSVVKVTVFLFIDFCGKVSVFCGAFGRNCVCS